MRRDAPVSAQHELAPGDPVRALPPTTAPELARAHTCLTEVEIAHIQRLIAGWGMLSDLCFGDLLVFAPVEAECVNEQAAKFVVLGQVRPSTNRTLHRSDLVGRIVGSNQRQLVVRAWELGQMVDGEFDVEVGGERARIQCIPMRYRSKVVAIMSRESPLGVGRKWGELERVYVELFERFARMILEGSFPFGDEEPITDYTPRVGDGILVLDKGGRVTYASPNAVNALHRVGVFGNTLGMRVDELVPEAAGVLDAYLVCRPVIEEVERHPGVTIVFHCIPLLDNAVPHGAVVLLRDVSDLRHRDRLLLSKDATIREVHHRVKNNLQTISSLLSLQARRLSSDEGRSALAEAERRIRSIAVVHEILSQEAGEQVPFDEAVTTLVRMSKEVFTGSGDLTVEVVGDAGALPADVATPLALVVAELLQNAAEHAFAEVEGADNAQREHRVELIFTEEDAHLVVEVRDDGVGLPEGFAMEKTRSLGLSIVRDLACTQMRGEMSMVSPVPDTGKGTSVVLHIPLEGHSETGL